MGLPSLITVQASGSGNILTVLAGKTTIGLAVGSPVNMTGGTPTSQTQQVVGFTNTTITFANPVPTGVTTAQWVPVVTPDVLRADYPAFFDKAIYTDSSIEYWLGLAYLLLNPYRWMNLLNFGIENFVAHNLVLETENQQSALDGGWPGVSRGAINSEVAGQVNVGYDTENTLELGAGHWNMTMYGRRFIHMARMAGAGPVQIGGGCAAPGSAVGAYGSFGPAWSGPNCAPGKFGS